MDSRGCCNRGHLESGDEITGIESASCRALHMIVVGKHGAKEKQRDQENNLHVPFDGHKL